MTADEQQVNLFVSCDDSFRVRSRPGGVGAQSDQGCVEVSGPGLRLFVRGTPAELRVWANCLVELADELGPRTAAELAADDRVAAMERAYRQGVGAGWNLCFDALNVADRLADRQGEVDR